MKWIATLLIVLFALPAVAQVSFNNVEARTTFRAAQEGDKGRLFVDNDLIRFADKDGAEYFTIPTSAVTDLFYSRVSGRRIKSALFISPLLFFSKGRKHYLTLTFDEGTSSGAVELELDKKNYRELLRTIEQVTGVAAQYDQEGIKDEKQDIAIRENTHAVLEISSNPRYADVQIDGDFNGSTPRVKRVLPGEYRIRVVKEGFDTWERTIVVEAGENVNLHAELRRNQP